MEADWPGDELIHIRELLDAGDIRGALIYLNRRTPHRFSALYVFGTDVEEAQYFYDDENPSAEKASDIPVLATYCVFVKDSKMTVRLSEPPDRQAPPDPDIMEIRSFTGVPLLDEQGEMRGTICHFDIEPVTILDREVMLVEAAAAYFLKAIRKHMLSH